MHVASFDLCGMLLRKAKCFIRITKYVSRYLDGFVCCFCRTCPVQTVHAVIAHPLEIQTCRYSASALLRPAIMRIKRQVGGQVSDPGT